MHPKIKILAICGSPHRGNTYEILHMLKESNPDVDFKILMLSELHLKDCLGCYSCINTGEENCPLNDDRDAILYEMAEADGTIFASPTYARTISALMKKFVERTSYLAHRPLFFGKYAMALSTCAGFGGDLTCKYIKENFGQCGFNFISTAALKTATKSPTEMDHTYRVALEAYNQLLNAIKSKEKFDPSLGQLVYFHIFKSIAMANKTKGWADYEFYKDKKDYYYDLKVPYVKNKLAKWVAKREVKKLLANR